MFHSCSARFLLIYQSTLQPNAPLKVSGSTAPLVAAEAGGRPSDQVGNRCASVVYVLAVPFTPPGGTKAQQLPSSPSIAFAEDAGAHAIRDGPNRFSYPILIPMTDNINVLSQLGETNYRFPRQILPLLVSDDGSKYPDMQTGNVLTNYYIHRYHTWYQGTIQ